MIAEAAPVAAYMALTVTLPALLLGHQGQDFPLRGVWRTARALIARRAPSACDRRALGRAVALASGETVTAPPVAVLAPPVRPTPAWARTDTEEGA
ncbi:hypothetical protein GCM10023084_02910 [Streptomyces lacrimifluminis]|uniref:hypothetical protein n=1 Tax=Streptomyces lacrimifluminis TaxID=1500077 RepID=UPI0031F14C0C